MATSSKVKFNLETLKEKALESLDFRIAQAELDVASHLDEEALAQKVEEWRVRQEEKVNALCGQLAEGDVDNYRLSKFKLDPIPEVDRWERRSAEGRLEGLRSKRSMVEAKAASLMADEDGGISLTKTQLQEFFGL